MDHNEAEPFLYTAKRLVDSRDLDAILEHNLNNLDAWRGRYPNHARWIRTVIKGISKDDYSRLAFGVFMHDGDHPAKLVCSAIVKKDHFGPYIEIKNVLLLNHPLRISEDRLRTHRQHCYRKLIQHIQQFAESRGYTKLVTELVNRNAEDRELIQAFLRCKFDVSGSQSRRFMPTDEIIILSYDIHPVYGLDPYDFDSAAKWLINRHIPEFQIVDHGEADVSRSLRIRINNDDGRLITKHCMQLSSHRTGLESLKKFSTSCDVLVIESYLAANNKLSAEDQLDVQFGFEPSGRVYIFDFAPKRNGRPTLWQRELLPKIQERHRNSAYFDRDELNALLYHPSTESALGREHSGRFRVTADLPLENVGGLLTLADPVRLQGETIESNRLNGKMSVYIKLGPKGKYAQAGQILVFYFPSSDSSSDAAVWGYAEIVEVQPFDIHTARDIQARKAKSGSANTWEQRSDADVVFDYLQELEDEESEGVGVATLWTREEFDRHNTYNATNEVVLFYVNRFVDLRSRVLPLERLLDGDPAESEFRRDAIVKEIDAYVSEQETERLIAHAGEAERDLRFVVPSTPYKFLSIWSSPDDQGRLSYEVGVLREIVAARREYIFVEPAINVNFLGLKDALLTNAPHLMHIGGHGTRAGLTFAGVDGSWTLDASSLNEALSSCRSHPFLIVLNCCYSDPIAQAISDRLFAIGFEDEFDDTHAQAFARYYMNALVKGFTAETIGSRLVDITRGFFHETRRRAAPHVWFKGKRVDS